MSAISNADIKTAMSRAQMSPPEVYMSSLRSSLSYPEHATPPEFSTDPCSLAGYGIGIASMGNPFPYKDGEKGTLPLIPSDTMVEQFSVLTARVAELVEQNKQKVRCPPAFFLPNPFPYTYIPRQPPSLSPPS
jgi:hypothetical protein